MYTSSKFLYYDRFNGILFLCSLLMVLTYYLNGNMNLKFMTAFFGLVILFRYLSVKSKVTIITLSFIAILILFYLIKSLYYGVIPSGFTFIYIVAQLGFGFYLIKGKQNSTIVSAIFYLASIIFFVQLLNGIHPSQMITFSENIVNFIFIALSVSMYFVRYVKGQKILLHPAIIVFIISFITSGRSGIITSLLLLLIVIYYKYHWKIKYFILFSIVTLMFSQKFNLLITAFERNISTRFGSRSGILENVRLNIWSEYIHALDISSIIFGFSGSEQLYFYGFDNPHNSFLSGHYILGIIQVIILILILYIILILVKENHIFVGLLLVILLIRSFTDLVLFTGNFDFIYMSILIYGCYLRYDSKMLKVP